MDRKTIAATKRTADMKAKRVRKQGYIPGVIYGEDYQSTPIMMESKSFNGLLRKAGQNVFFEIAMENEIKPVRLKEVQRDPISKDIIHVDAQVISNDQKIKANVPIRIEGINDTVRRDVTIQRQKNSVQVEGLAQHIPTHFSILVKGLEQGQKIMIGDLEISEELSIIDKKDDIIVSAVRNSRLDIDVTDDEVQEEEGEGQEAKDKDNQDMEE